MQHKLLCFLVLLLPCQAVLGQEEGDFASQRERMVQSQLAARDISNRRVLEAMGAVPRHLFVPPGFRARAYDGYPLPIGNGQTISQPYIVGLMTQLIDPQPEDKVLEIGTGSGYQAAVLSVLCREVYTIEIVEPLAKEAKQRLQSLGYDNVFVRYGDGFHGWDEHAPYTKIIVTAAAPRIPEPLSRQLAEGGTIVLPLKNHALYETLAIGRKKKGKIELTRVSAVRFVPMTGKIRE